MPTSQRLPNNNTMAYEQNNDTILQPLQLKLLKEEYSETILQHNYDTALLKSDLPAVNSR